MLEENGEPAKALKASNIHRTKLWVYSAGKGKPSAATAAVIERLTEGRVKANGWETDVTRPAVGEDDAA